MNQRALLFLVCMIAGFGLANIPTSTVITEGVANFFEIIGAASMIIFGLATIYLGILTLFNR